MIDGLFCAAFISNCSNSFDVFVVFFSLFVEALCDVKKS